MVSTQTVRDVLETEFADLRSFASDRLAPSEVLTRLTGELQQTGLAERLGLS